MLKKALVISSVTLLTACGGSGPGTEKWCAAKKEEPKSQWTMEDGKIYAQKCLIDGAAIGSEEWCAKRKEKDKERRSAGEARKNLFHRKHEQEIEQHVAGAVGRAEGPVVAVHAQAHLDVGNADADLRRGQESGSQHRHQGRQLGDDAKRDLHRRSAVCAPRQVCPSPR